VDHDDGWQTTYGNLAAITVKQGGRVKAGETIGRGGAAESNDSPRVHFQVQRNGRAYDPLYVLPVTQMGLPAQPATNAVCGAEAITLDANSVVNLSITSDALRRYELEAASVTAVSDGAPEIAPGTLGLLSLVLQVPPGAGADYLLHLTLSKPGDRIAFDCDLALRNATDVPLSVAPPVRQTAPVAPTPFGGPPTATPTVTPFPSPTATPLPADAAVEARPQARPEVPSPTPFGGQRPSATPAPSATPDTRKNKPSLPSMLHAAGTPRAVTTPTPTRVPLAAFPRQYAGAAPQP
jgi:pyruvate/2-oxoglutarate dehydrogenase complex dihydrolipoamide acyltransferase (E2) component